MEPEIDKKSDFKNRLFFFLDKNKLKLIIIIVILFIVGVTSIFLNENYKKKNEKISQEFIKAGLFLTSDKDKSKNIYKSIIMSKNDFYSVLALNSLIENNLEENTEEVLGYFELIENLNLSKEKKNLIIFKKSLYLIKNVSFEEGKNLLKTLINSDSKYESLAKEIIID